MPGANQTRSLQQGLQERIEASAHSGEVVDTTLATSERIISRVTDGVYREPWAAFRELVANAYDADASFVTIETNVPDFGEILVRDDGIGMDAKTLAYVLTRIGGSWKRTNNAAEYGTADQDDPEKSPGGRPFIGKIGIGMFAVAQLTQNFQIVTKKADGLRLSAHVQLATYDEARPPRDTDNKYVAGEVKITTEMVEGPEASSHGTSVILYSLRPAILKTLRSTQLWEAADVETSEGDAARARPKYHIGFAGPGGTAVGPKLPWSPDDSPGKRFARFCDSVGEISGAGSKLADLDFLDEYLRMVWKLSLSLPLPYLERHPFDLDGSSGLWFLDLPEKGRRSVDADLRERAVRDHFQLETREEDPGGGFSVMIDGVQISRPLRFPRTQLGLRSRIRRPVMMVGRTDKAFRERDLHRAGGNLSFEAYLYWNGQIVPKETRGVLIRIKEASGTLFDPTFLNYRVSEQSRLRQITAEIFVREGLDGALNIDRESFNQSHPHFLYVQRWMHRALRLLANRLKEQGAQELKLVRAAAKKAAHESLEDFVMGIWSGRLGIEADPPLPGGRLTDAMPKDIADVEIRWPKTTDDEEARRLQAFAIVLEAYGVLSNLTGEDRESLIAHIRDVYRGKAE